MSGPLERAAELLARHGRTAVLTGAGVSVESGIPDFRSPEGLWTRFDPFEYATLEAFRATPRKVWRMLAEMEEVLGAARPNAGHLALARLEAEGIVEGIVTQNIDGLHQAAGSRAVVEFHGSHRTLSCLACGERHTREEVSRRGVPPPCDCGALLKPDVIFFGEEIPAEALRASTRLATRCRVLLVVGTSAEVAPASQIPWLAKQAGATIVEVNLAPSSITAAVTDLFLEGAAGEVLPRLTEAALRRRAAVT